LSNILQKLLQRRKVKRTCVAPLAWCSIWLILMRDSYVPRTLQEADPKWFCTLPAV
jgi:hypothetical protein